VPTVPRIHIEVPEDDHRRVKVAAAQQGVTLKAFVIQTLEQATAEVGRNKRKGR
jgi:predicted HicB family RNase H-like nuclease